MSGPDDAAGLVRLLDGWLAGTGITLLDLRTPEQSVRLVRPGNAPAPAAPIPAPPSAVVTSPGPGTFLDRHPADEHPLAAPRRTVRVGDVVGLVQVGKLLLHVAAPASGTVVELMAEPGSTVGYGAPLLRLERSDPA